MIAQRPFLSMRDDPGLPRALVIEAHPMMSTVVTEAGWQCTQLHPLQFVEQQDHNCFSDIRSGKVDFIWIRQPWRTVMPHKSSVHMRCLT